MCTECLPRGLSGSVSTREVIKVISLGEGTAEPLTAAYSFSLEVQMPLRRETAELFAGCK